MQKRGFKGLQKNKKTKGMNKPAGISEKVINILDAYTLIAQKRYPSVSFLSDRFGVSGRTVHRYLEIIGMIDPVVIDKEKGGYVFENGDRIKKMNLAHDDLLLLMTMGEAVAHLGTPMRERFQRFTESFMNLAKAPLSADNRAPILIKMPDAIGNSQMSDFFAHITACINDRRSIDIIYKTLSSGETSQRRIDPYGLIFYEGAWLLAAYCHTREEIRNFAIDRIAELKETNLFFKPIDDFDLQTYVTGSWGIYHDEMVDVTVRFSARVADYIVRKEKWHPSEKRRILPNGDVELTFTVAGVKEIKRWIYSWVPNVEVIEPEWFRERMKKEFREVTTKLA